MDKNDSLFENQKSSFHKYLDSDFICLTLTRMHYIKRFHCLYIACIIAIRKNMKQR